MLCQFHYCHVITIFDPCIDDRRYISVFIEGFEDAKGVIRIVNRRRTDNTMAKRKKNKISNNDLQSIPQKDRATRAPLKTGVSLGRVGSSCSTCGTSRIILVTYPVKSREHERGKGRIVIMTKGTYPWQYVKRYSVAVNQVNVATVKPLKR